MRPNDYNRYLLRLDTVTGHKRTGSSCLGRDAGRNVHVLATEMRKASDEDEAEPAPSHANAD